MIWPISEEGAARANRFQQAREVYYNHVGLTQDLSAAFDEVIKTATRVKITDEIESAAEAATGRTIHDYDAVEMRAVLMAAFRAAGFEVIE